MIRLPEITELDQLAGIWFEGWQDAHAEILPKELKEDRTFESCRTRLADLLEATSVLGPIGAPYGFCSLKDDELYQLYVSATFRGTGAAHLLMHDAEARLSANGVRKAWLACAIGNDRAARFYEKSGWRRVGVVTNRVQLSSGPFDLDVWRFEKDL